MKENKKAVIFDLDGVLVDTGKFHKQSWFDLAEEEGFEMTDEFFDETFGMQNEQIIPELAGKDISAEKIKQMSDWKEARYRKLIAGKLELLNGVYETIVNLKNSGFILAIGTSTPKINLDFLLDNVDIREYFDAFVTGEDVQNGKPAPDTFLKAAEKLNVNTEKCIVIEDAIPGVKAAKNANMKVIAVTTTRKREQLKEAGIIVDSLSELKIEDFEKLLTL